MQGTAHLESLTRSLLVGGARGSSPSKGLHLGVRDIDNPLVDSARDNAARKSVGLHLVAYLECYVSCLHLSLPSTAHPMAAQLLKAKLGRGRDRDE